MRAPARDRRDDPVELAVAAWSLVHGVAALRVDGELKDHVRSAEAAEQLAGRLTERFLLGLAPR